MSEQKQPQRKVMVGVVTSDKMEKTVAVKVTTFKVHPLYHKRYRWTKKYLSDVGTLNPQVGDTVRIVSSRPLSKHKRWIVEEVVTQAGQSQLQQARKESARVKATKSSAKKKGK